MKKLIKSALIASTAIAGCSLGAFAANYDIIIKGATIFDGSGNAGYIADIGINGEYIAAIDVLSTDTAARTINAAGLALSPGFIDLHSHAENGMAVRPLATNIVQQGITTILGGNCGFSPVDIAGYFTALETKGNIGPNIGLLIGHNNVREAVMGKADKHADADELASMENVIDAGMKAGAFGISTGLKYVPGAYSNTNEVIELSKIAAANNGIYATHMREEGVGLLDATAETINIGTTAKIPVHISHHKAIGLVSWGMTKQSLKMIDDARNKGQDVTLDQYPYTASSTGFGILFPAWAQAGGQDALLKRLADPVERQKIKDGIIHNIKTDRGGGDPARIQVAVFKPDPSFNGKTFKDILIERGIELTIPNAAELAIEIQSKGGGQAIYHAMHEDDVKRVMQYRYTSIATDTGAIKFGMGNPHPRGYGTFPRVLGKYVRQEGVLKLPDAIRKMTSLPASRMGLTDRGSIKVGYFADLVVFNPATIIDSATFANPHQYAVGINYVIINGKIAKNPDGLTDVGSGKALRHGR